jgi:ABC-type sugar transport system ATPase subunit
MISIRNLTFSRGNRNIFDNISLDIMPHKITAIMGPSGTGKTTLLKLIAPPESSLGINSRAPRKPTALSFISTSVRIIDSGS